MTDANLITTFAILAGLILAGAVVIIWVRRWTRREPGAEPFTFQDLREMRARGEINDREFAAMRAALLARMGVDPNARDPRPPAEQGGDS